MSKSAQALADLQAELEKTRIIEELTERLRLKESETCELKRQLVEVCKQLTEQTLDVTATATELVEASGKSSGLPPRRCKLSNDALPDVLTFLNRFNIDTAQLTCHLWQETAKKILIQNQPLRELLYVTLKREKKPRVNRNSRARCWSPPTTPTWEPTHSPWRSERYANTFNDGDSIFVVSYGRSGEAPTLLAGTAHEEMRRALTFQSCDAASDYLLGVIRSATIDHLRMESIAPSEAFFKELFLVAPTVRAKKLTLSECHLDDVDAATFRQTLLQFQYVRNLSVGIRLRHAHISDGFLAEAAKGLNLTQLCYDTTEPIGSQAATFDVTDDGIMKFLFQDREEPGDVKLQILHANISSTFCTVLLQTALTEKAKNHLYLALRADNLQQDLTGILQWRRPDLDWNPGYEVYDVEAPDGKRHRLTINRKPCGTISWLEFQRGMFGIDGLAEHMWDQGDGHDDEVGWFDDDWKNDNGN